MVNGGCRRCNDDVKSGLVGSALCAPPRLERVAGRRGPTERAHGGNVLRHRVLVVAQDVMLRSTLARWLMSAGYIVELAESERRAREVFANHKVALTLLAPSRSGGPVLDLADTGGKLIVVAEQPHDRAPAADGYLSVPLDEQEVLACIKSVLQTEPGDDDKASQASESWGSSQPRQFALPSALRNEC